MLYIKNVIQKYEVREDQAIECIKSEIDSHGNEIKAGQSNVTSIEINWS